MSEKTDQAVIRLAARIYPVDQKLHLETRALEPGRSADDDRWFIGLPDLPWRWIIWRQ